VTPTDIATFRKALKLSRSDLARFLGVADVSLVRWEAPDGSSPKGLPLLILQALATVRRNHPEYDLRRLVREGPANHADAIKTLLELASEPPAKRARTGGAR